MGVFEKTVAFAIDEILSDNGSASKFGMIIPNDNLEKLKEDLISLMVTSRNLQTAGNKFLSGGSQSSSSAPSHSAKADQYEKSSNMNRSRSLTTETNKQLKPLGTLSTIKAN